MRGFMSLPILEERDVKIMRSSGCERAHSTTLLQDKLYCLCERHASWPFDLKTKQQFAMETRGSQKRLTDHDGLGL